MLLCFGTLSALSRHPGSIRSALIQRSFYVLPALILCLSGVNSALMRRCLCALSAYMFFILRYSARARHSFLFLAFTLCLCSVCIHEVFPLGSCSADPAFFSRSFCASLALILRLCGAVSVFFLCQLCTQLALFYTCAAIVLLTLSFLSVLICVHSLFMQRSFGDLYAPVLHPLGTYI